MANVVVYVYTTYHTYLCRTLGNQLEDYCLFPFRAWFCISFLPSVVDRKWKLRAKIINVKSLSFYHRRNINYFNGIILPQVFVYASLRK